MIEFAHTYMFHQNEPNHVSDYDLAGAYIVTFYFINI